MAEEFVSPSSQQRQERVKISLRRWSSLLHAHRVLDRLDQATAFLVDPLLAGIGLGEQLGELDRVVTHDLAHRVRSAAARSQRSARSPSIMTVVSPSVTPPPHMRYRCRAPATVLYGSGRASTRALDCRVCFFCSSDPVTSSTHPVAMTTRRSDCLLAHIGRSRLDLDAASTPHAVFMNDLIPRHRGHRDRQVVRRSPGPARHRPHRAHRHRVRPSRAQRRRQDHHGPHPFHAHQRRRRRGPDRRVRRQDAARRRTPLHRCHRAVLRDRRAADRPGEPPADGRPRTPARPRGRCPGGRAAGPVRADGRRRPARRDVLRRHEAPTRPRP